MARVRMVYLYDLAKKNNALVCGTENKTEYMLGYFTKHGDGASDFEPIIHLYKTEIFALAKYLGVSKEIRSKSPTAGLWDGQTDEGEFGFRYEDADRILRLAINRKRKAKSLIAKGFGKEIVEAVMSRVKKNMFKQKAP